MRSLRRLTALVTPLAMACSGSGAPTPGGGLSYDVPSVPSATYVTGDSLDISVDSPMGTMAMNRDSETTLAMVFERVSEGVQVTAAVERFRASMSSQIAGNISADEEDVSGDLVFVLHQTQLHELH